MAVSTKAEQIHTLPPGNSTRRYLTHCGIHKCTKKHVWWFHSPIIAKEEKQPKHERMDTVVFFYNELYSWECLKQLHRTTWTDLNTRCWVKEIRHVRVHTGWFPYTLSPRIVKARGAWVAQYLERLTLAQAMIFWSVSSSPASGSVLTAWSLEPASDSVSPSLSAPSLLMLCLSLSLKNKHLRIKKYIYIISKANPQMWHQNSDYYIPEGGTKDLIWVLVPKGVWFVKFVEWYSFGLWTFLILRYTWIESVLEKNSRNAASSEKSYLVGWNPSSGIQGFRMGLYMWLAWDTNRGAEKGQNGGIQLRASH